MPGNNHNDRPVALIMSRLSRDPRDCIHHTVDTRGMTPGKIIHQVIPPHPTQMRHTNRPSPPVILNLQILSEGGHVCARDVDTADPVPRAGPERTIQWGTDRDATEELASPAPEEIYEDNDSW
ncbi:non-virion protein [Snakehead rhabdovirus]|uniref:Non-virion protein n=1 Tax=Snakehead rhabdovirus TaxID=103603 RepID=NV_SHRV|nr:non-virion protein [Snakehead virus]Q9QJT5.1 RecName: Full=Non-virion protein [Snakehead virus]AAD56770.1 non-virion protein [Snakehead virus]